MIHKEKLDSLCHINSGGTPSRGVAVYYGGKIPWAKIGDIEKSNGVIYSTEEYITEAGLESIGNRIFPKDTLLFAMYGSVGKVAFSGIELSTNQAILGIRLKQEAKEKLYLEYLKYWFQVNLLFFKGRAVGGILKNLSATIVRDFDIPLPSLTAQKRIAKVLSECEALIQKRKESINLLDELLRSIFLELFGESSLNKKQWSKVPIKQLGDVITGNTPPRSNPDNYSSNHIEWIKTDNIQSVDLYITEASEYLSLSGIESARTVTNGALLVACIAGSLESIGRSALTNRTVSFNQQINAIQPFEDVEPFFLYWSFRISKKYIQRHATKGMKKILTKGEFEKIKMIKPPHELQTKFSIIANKINPIKKLCQDSLKELENLYGSISQKAFNGELDLSKIDISDMEESKKKTLTK